MFIIIIIIFIIIIIIIINILIIKIFITKPQLKSYLQSTSCYKNKSSKHYLQFHPLQKKPLIIIIGH